MTYLFHVAHKVCDGSVFFDLVLLYTCLMWLTKCVMVLYFVIKLFAVAHKVCYGLCFDLVL